ncbi:HNH endonuclease signature motif containing protein [Mycolicibacterium lacusdiani]|uniref:HNH endonuclease signature motif containing protein n=1 Tax=Mycolicibacterium lacusdiani TaxID=2895283 RepID=UPI001F3438D5|nr:HNH endonuclease signature motif containing protein [Mycolicibacterium lacusdiani]
MYVRTMQADVVAETIARLRAAHDALAALPIETLQSAELLSAMDELEGLSCQLPAQRERLLARLQTQTAPRAMGAKSWNEVLRVRWRIGSAEAGKRLADAADLAPRRSLTGDPMAPLMPATAAAQAAGLINPEHVAVLRDTLARLPRSVDALTRDQLEVDLVRVALGVGPKELKGTAERRLFLLDQDGAEPDESEREARRGATMARQQSNGTSRMTADLTPEGRALFEAAWAKLAGPGMCNPADAEPCVFGTPTQAQIDDDQRTPAQRRHDALVAIGRIALMGGDLGRLNGLPVTVIVRTTLQDLESRAGVGVTGGGTIIPIKDVIRMGSHANHYLAIFDRATGSALDLFRTRRVASPAQRVMLMARDGGCTKPGCTVGAYGCQVHHAAEDWASGGLTNVDDLGLACGADNRMVGDDDRGWTTAVVDGVVEWTPPPALDTGQSRVNYHHRPELLLRPPDDDPPTTERDAGHPGGPEPPDATAV